MRESSRRPHGTSTSLTSLARTLSGIASNAFPTFNITEGSLGAYWASTRSLWRRRSNLSRTTVKLKERRSTGASHQVLFRVTPTSISYNHTQLDSTEDEEHEFQINRANFAASRIISNSHPKSNRGGRGGGRGGRGGRGGGGRGKREPKQNNPSTDKKTPGDAGAKRKRPVEPDGDPHGGVRGATVPMVRSTSKKAKTDEGDS